MERLAGEIVIEYGNALLNILRQKVEYQPDREILDGASGEVAGDATGSAARESFKLCRRKARISVLPRVLQS